MLVHNSHIIPPHSQPHSHLFCSPTGAAPRHGQQGHALAVLLGRAHHAVAALHDPPARRLGTQQKSHSRMYPLRLSITIKADLAIHFTDTASNTQIICTISTATTSKLKEPTQLTWRTTKQGLCGQHAPRRARTRWGGRACGRRSGEAPRHRWQAPRVNRPHAPRTKSVQ